jgi:type I site-specific restriction-modification system R (restriction) subunit
LSRKSAIINLIARDYLIDFENPKVNTLRITTEATFHVGREHRRYDMVFWVNGFPLVVGEMKTPKDKNISWLNDWEAWTNPNL